MGKDLAKTNDNLRAVKARIHDRPTRASIEFVEGENGRVLVVGKDGEGTELDGALLHDATGSSSNQFVSSLLSRIIETLTSTGDYQKDADNIAAAIALVASVEPRSELEATMALQMVAANEAGLWASKKAKSAQFIEHVGTYSNMATKQFAAFRSHAEAIAKMRRGGEQIVKHVHVNEGGQAVIAGTVNTSGGGGR